MSHVGIGAAAAAADGYECKAKCTCGVFVFRVRYRRRGEDLVEWMEKQVRPAMGAAHTSRLCMAQACDLMLPVTDAAGIGMRVEH